MDSSYFSDVKNLKYMLIGEFGYVTIRWLGESNGYYSESVDFEKVK